MYKLRMAEQLGSIVDTADLDGFIPVFSAPSEPLSLMEVSFEHFLAIELPGHPHM